MRHELTKDDIKKMEEEIEHRKVNVRKELLEHVKVARAHGDLSENFEYKAAKKEKNQNESRIRYLERMIRTSSVLEDLSNEHEVGINDSVEVIFDEDDSVIKEEATYRIVTTVRQDSMKGLISVESPLGKALLGHQVGDRIEVRVDSSYSYYVIIKSLQKSKDETGDDLRKY